MSPDKLDTLERERREADRQYNDALTAFDAALIPATAHAGAPPSSDSTLPEFPAGWRGWITRAVHGWLAPWMERQHAFNARTAESLGTLTQRESERAVAFERFQAALITFLQRNTAFVDTKDRLLTAVAASRIEQQQEVLALLAQRVENAVPELRAQVSVLQRAMETLKRHVTEPGPATAAADVSARSRVSTANPPPIDSTDDYKYVGFEDAFRGSYEHITANLAEYVPIFAGATDVVDLGCGRGEFLMALKSAGVSARGVDTNAAMVAAAREHGLDVSRGDALGYIAPLPDTSLGGVIATQVVEHMEPSYLLQLLDAVSRTLRPGAPLVLETINPASWYAFFSSYIRDPTHVRPVHPETLQYLVRASGFERVEIRYRSPLPDHAKLKTVYLPEELRASDDLSAATLTQVVDTLNANTARLNELMFGPMDYAVIGYRI